MRKSVSISESKKSESRRRRRRRKRVDLQVCRFLFCLHHWRLVLVVRGLGGSVHQSDQAGGGGGLAVGGKLRVVSYIVLLQRKINMSRSR